MKRLSKRQTNAATIMKVLHEQIARADAEAWELKYRTELTDALVFVTTELGDRTPR